MLSKPQSRGDFCIVSPIIDAGQAARTDQRTDRTRQRWVSRAEPAKSGVAGQEPLQDNAHCVVDMSPTGLGPAWSREKAASKKGIGVGHVGDGAPEIASTTKNQGSLSYVNDRTPTAPEFRRSAQRKAWRLQPRPMVAASAPPPRVRPDQVRCPSEEVAQYAALAVLNPATRPGLDQSAPSDLVPIA